MNSHFFLLKIGMLIGTNTILLVGKTSYIWGTFFRTQGNKCLTSVVDQIYSFVATTIRTYQEICIYPSTTRNQLFAECLGVCRVHSIGHLAMVCRVPDKRLSVKRLFSDQSLPWALCRGWLSANPFFECFWAFVECFWHSTNLWFPIVRVGYSHLKKHLNSILEKW